MINVCSKKQLYNLQTRPTCTGFARVYNTVSITNVSVALCSKQNSNVYLAYM